jgi:hypothetical protein
MKKNYAVIVMAIIAPSPGPLSKRFGQTVDAILRRDNIEHWNENKDDDLVSIEETADEETEKVIVVNVEEDAIAEEDDVVILSDTPGNVVVKEEVVVVEEDSDNDIEESTLIDDIEESNDSVEVHVENNDDIVSEADVDFATLEKVPDVAEDVATIAEEVEDDIVYYKDAQMEYEFGELRKENGVYFAPLMNPVLIQTPVVRLAKPISGDSTIVRVSDGFAKFVKNHEENMLRLTKENKDKWFKNGIDDDALDGGFKSFLESDMLKVKISDDFAAFDTVGDFIDGTFCTPAEVRCILKISGVWFGSVEFGSVMSLVQTQLVKLPKCSIKSTRERKKNNYVEDFA